MRNGKSMKKKNYRIIIIYLYKRLCEDFESFFHSEKFNIDENFVFLFFFFFFFLFSVVSVGGMNERKSEKNSIIIK